jgi:RecA/RadA recombinase
MSKLLRKFRDEAKDVGKSKILPSYSTGFPGLDYRNGYVDKNGELSLGVEGGKFIMFIGKSGVGKTTCAIQVAANIVAPFEDGLIVHMDYERATNPERVRKIIGWSEEDVKNKYEHKNTGIYAETIDSVVRQMYDMKMSMFNELKYDTGAVDEVTGAPIFELPPSVVIMDSIPFVAPQKIDEQAKTDNNMRAAQSAKVIGTVAKQIAGLMQEANIYVLSINHIQQKIETSAFNKTAADINYLKQDEVLPGGRVMSYVQNYIFRLDHAGMLKPDEEYGVKGFKVLVSMVKSRSGEAGNSTLLVFEQAHGMNPYLSSLAQLLDMKAIQSGVSMSVPGSAVKFSRKNFLEKINSDPEFKDAFDTFVHEQFFAFVPEDRDTWDSEAPAAEEEEADEAPAKPAASKRR